MTKLDILRLPKTDVLTIDTRIKQSREAEKAKENEKLSEKPMTKERHSAIM